MYSCMCVPYATYSSTHTQQVKKRTRICYSMFNTTHSQACERSIAPPSSLPSARVPFSVVCLCGLTHRLTTTAYYNNRVYYDNRVCRSDCSDRSFTTPFFTDRSYPSFSLTTHLPNTYRTISMPWGAPGGDPLALTAPVPSPTKQQSWQRSAGWRHDP